MFSPPPVVSSFSPVAGQLSTVVTVYGANFTTATEVTFNGAAAGFMVLNDSTLTTAVPTGATSGPIYVTNPAATTASAQNFSVQFVSEPGSGVKVRQA